MEIWRDVFRDTPKKIRERKDFRFPPIIPIVLYIEQKKDTYEIIEGLKKLASTLDGLGNDGSQVFKNWLKEIVCQGLPRDGLYNFKCGQGYYKGP